MSPWPAMTISQAAQTLGWSDEELLDWAEEHGHAMRLASDRCSDALLDALVEIEPPDTAENDVDPIEALLAAINARKTPNWFARRCPELDPNGNVIEICIGERSFIVGSPVHAQVHLNILAAAQNALPILISGESGCGKELAAREAHVARARGGFVAFNCAAVPENIAESELFGHVKGAFWGADEDREGLLLAANGGTVFLDELGEMALRIQAKLLRALQERCVRPVGSDREIAMPETLIVSATNADLTERVRQGRFREDLYYRLNVVNVAIPPLRARRMEIVPIAQHDLRSRGCSQRLTLRAMHALYNHSWPGNVRELENKLKRALAVAHERIEPADLGLASEPSKVAMAPSMRRGSGGRPQTHDRIEIRKLSDQGLSPAQIAERVKAPLKSVERILRELRSRRPT